MDPVTVGWLTTGLMFILLILGVPVAFSMGIAGMAGWFMIGGMTPALGLANLVLYAQLTQFEYSVIPLFILMGDFVFFAGFGADLYKAARAWVGHLSGGLAMATVVACGAFGAVSGSTIAAAATFGKIAVPEMLKSGYDKRLASGCVTAAGTVAAMIPPSILMVIYGVVTQQSIGKLLIGGVFPGILEVILYSTMIYIWAKLNPHIGPAAPSSDWGTRFSLLKGIWGVIIIAMVVIGGIYSGIFTPSEAGAIAALAAFLVGILGRRFKWDDIKKSFLQTTGTTAMIFTIVVGAFVFSYQFSVSRIPEIMSTFIIGLNAPPLVIMSTIVVMYLVLGCFIGSMAMMFLTLPFIFPAVVALGYDPIWFGILMVHLCEMAQITPPFAVNIFAVAAVVPQVETGDIIKGVIPFVGVGILDIVLLFAFPQIALFLPSLMK